MASRTLTRAAVRAAKPASALQQRTFLSVLTASRATSLRSTQQTALRAATQQTRGVKTVDFAGTKEVVYGTLRPAAPPEPSGYLPYRMELIVLERDDWPRQRLHEYFKNDTLALIGYGSQGHGQGLNLRDNGLNVIVGVRKNGASWKEALDDGWTAGQNLFDIDEAISRGTIIMNLLSDAAQSETWPAIKPQLTKGKVGITRTCNDKD